MIYHNISIYSIRSWQTRIFIPLSKYPFWHISISLTSTSRLSMVSSLDIVLPICESGHCELHPVTDWPRLDEICTNLLGSLKEIVLRVSECSDDITNQRLKDFLRQQKREGKNICLASTPPDAAPMFRYYWGAAAEDTACLTNLIMKTCRGKTPIIRIRGGSQEAALPPNIFQVLSNQAEDGVFYLRTDTKIKNISGHTLNHLNSCVFLDLFNDGPIQEDEVAAMEAILAHVAQEPRPLNPSRIILPKVTISLYRLSFSICATATITTQHNQTILFNSQISYSRCAGLVRQNNLERVTDAAKVKQGDKVRGPRWRML